MPGGVAGVPPHMEAPYADVAGGFVEASASTIRETARRFLGERPPGPDASSQ